MRWRRRPDPAAIRLWREHLQAPFPERLRGEELAGVDMVMIDSTIAGFVSSWQVSSGALSAARRAALAASVDELGKVLPLLTDDELAYCRRLRDLAVVVLETRSWVNVDLMAAESESPTAA